MLTKEEIANIKRIDTSLNVFKKKIKSLEEKKRKLVDPIITEMMSLTEEIDFWQKPVIERYGKTTEELLQEAGEETSEDISNEEEKEVVTESSSEEDMPADITEDIPEVKPESEKISDADTLGYEDMPEEWK